MPNLRTDPSSHTGFAVLDLETTGLQPKRGARIIEIGVVIVDTDGAVTGEWETLVDAGRGAGPTHIHGVNDAMLEGAPSFAEIAGDLAELLVDRVLVAHNARFDVGFLDAEFRRADIAWSREALCTMQLAKRRGHYPVNLAACCETYAITNHGAHRALGDALATAELLRCLQVGADELPPAVAFPAGLPASSGRVHARTGG